MISAIKLWSCGETISVHSGTRNWHFLLNEFSRLAILIRQGTLNQFYGLHLHHASGSSLFKSTLGLTAKNLFSNPLFIGSFFRGHRFESRAPPRSSAWGISFGARYSRLKRNQRWWNFTKWRLQVDSEFCWKALVQWIAHSLVCQNTI